MTNEQILMILQKLIAEQFAMEPTEVTENLSVVDDLGADSVDLVELVMALEDEFDIGEIQEEDISSLKTVGDTVRYIADKVSE